MAENKDLTAEVTRLRQQLETAEKEKAVQESQNLVLSSLVRENERKQVSVYLVIIPEHY